MRFMNEHNSPEINNKNVASPLRHDIDGRFSRDGKIKTMNPKLKSFLENSIIVLFITFLLATDFILFAGSGNLTVFNNSIFPIKEITIIIFGFLITTSLIVYIIRNHPLLKASLSSFITFAIIFMLYKQFSLFPKIFTLGATTVSSYIILGLASAGICFVIFYNKQKIWHIALLIMSFILFLHVCTAYYNKDNHEEFIESYNSNVLGKGKDERYIYILLPNFTSYLYLASQKSNEAYSTREVMNGFYQKNNFTVYPKAFVPKISYLDNIVHSLNPQSNLSADAHILKTRMLSEYWRFHNIRREYINLKDNGLYDFYHEKGYNISAYKSRDFDMCHKNHELNVDRCIEKVNHPINIYDINISTSSKINILLMEWLASMRINHRLSGLYSVLTKFLDLEKTPMVGVNYNNLYVVGSTKTLDVLLNNIKQDKGKQAYFVFVDLPSDMYIYDEFCRIKPQNEWFNITSLPWLSSDLREERRTAYMQQTRCLFGEMQYFMDRMKEDDLLKNSTVVLMGISGIKNDFRCSPIKDFRTGFLANQMVGMAIYQHKNNAKNNVDWRFCSTNQLLNSFLQNKNMCDNKPDIGVHTKFASALNKSLNEYARDIKKSSVPYFDKWYERWLNNNILRKKQQNIDIKIIVSKKDIKTNALVDNTTKTTKSAEQSQNQEPTPNVIIEEVNFEEFGL